MIKTAAVTIIALLVGAIVTKTLYPSSNTNSFIASDHDTLERIISLENRLNEEIENRLLLQNELDAERTLRIELAQRVNELNNASVADSEFTGNIENIAPTLNRSSFGLPNADDQVAKLLNAGFDADVAERVVGLETQMYQSIINARFGGTQTNPRDVILTSQRTIREELGDDQYELYLETTDRATTVPVAAIAENSAGAAAGLQVGDEIVSYDGERIFNLLDLQESTQSGTAGQTVIVDVKRGDSTLSLALPRGQIGISTGRAGFGFNRRRN